jgi:hypothetical protein
MIQTGSPGTVTETDDFANGVENWSNVNNVKVSDDSRATALATDISYVIRCEDFGFTIPTGSTINSITVEVEGKTSISFQACVYQSKLLKAGVLVGDFGLPSLLTDTDTVLDVSDAGLPLWGTTWTPAQINAVDFGVCVNVDQLRT